MVLQVRPGIMEISPYVGGKSNVSGVSRVVKLSSNENALGASDRAVEAYSGAGASLFRYPDGHALRLREVIAEVNGLEPERLVCGAGSDEIIGLLCKAYAGPGDEVLYSAHGFLMYKIYALGAGASVVEAPESDLKTHVDALLASVTERTKIVFVANPNNPTGSYISESELKRLRDGLPEQVLLVVDGAYHEFVSCADYSSGESLVRCYDNVVMTRTFSKIYGLASLRLGWCYASEAIVDVLNRIRGPFNVSGAALAAGEAAMLDQEFVVRSRAHNDQAITYLSEQLLSAGYTVYPSVGNFLLVDFLDEGKADIVDDTLKSQGVIVRQVKNYKLPSCLRVTVGTDADNTAFLNALLQS